MIKKQSLFSTLILAVLILVSVGFKNEKTEKPDLIKKEKTITFFDNKIVLGNWVRSDANYSIKITEVGKNGKLVAGYFNPKSINVSKATWTNAKGVFKIYIELRDENYPGSYYNLTYYPEKDLLVGKYFQAVTRETFDVLFTRIK